MSILKRLPALLGTLFVLLLLILAVAHLHRPGSFADGAGVAMATSESVDTDAEKLAVVADAQILEASGLAISHCQDNAVWMHNDSGDTARLFLVGLNGKTLAVVSLKNVDAFDWEDMCSFEADGERWLLVGDTGDNARQRGKKNPKCRLLLIKEPTIDAKTRDADKPVEIAVDVVSQIEFQFPDGPEDCESLAVDTEQRQILLMTKTNPLTCRLFQMPLNLSPGKQNGELALVSNLAVPYATAMDISGDGRSLVAVNMLSGVLVRRANGETWQLACKMPAQVLNLPARPQGESVCFAAGGNSLLLNSEGVRQPLWRVAIPSAEE